MKWSCIVALVTPMGLDGQVDYTSLASLIEWHIASGTEAIVILGTTGESPTLTQDERSTIIKNTIAQVNKRIAVIVGTGTYDTRSTIILSQEAEVLGADGVLIINPYYNRPTQQGLFLHFQAVNDAINIPIILYHHPARTGGQLAEETVVKLSPLKNIIGLKEVSNDMHRVNHLRTQCGASFLLWSGCDNNVLDFIKAGGNGVVSVTANIVPMLMKNLVHDALNNQWPKAYDIQEKLLPLHHATCLETNPIPVKYALYLMKKIPCGIRLPLTLLEPSHQEILKKVLLNLHLI